MAGFGGWGLSVLRSCRQLFLAVAAAAIFVFPAFAQSAQPPEPLPWEKKPAEYGWRETWGGADAMRDVWLLYTGMTIAPWSEHIYEPGWRIRVQSGYGQYRYNYFPSGETTPQQFKVEINYSDALIGYHMRLGELTAKAFGGFTTISHKAPGDYAFLKPFKTEMGPKGLLELWLNVGETQWTSLNLSFTTAHKTAAARWRYGFKLLPELSVGPELRFDTNAQRYANYGEIFDGYLGRVGVSASYKWPSLELSIAGGMAATMNGEERERVTPYGTINLLYQY